jgi:phosphate transport system substrate-binding protein
MNRMLSLRSLPAIVLSLSMLVCGGCGPGGKAIQNTGSDTMLNLAQAWAEAYHGVKPSVSIQVAGGGSGVGIAALESGTVDIANASRSIKPAEAENAKKNTGKTPVESMVGYDALAVYVHKDNPLEQISIEELAQIYGEGGKIDKWSQLGIQNKLCQNDEIIRVSRQSSSGTYMYFKETLVGEKGEYKPGARDMNGSKDVVDLVTNTPCAIGYSGMGYKTDAVKWLKVSKKKGEPAISPSIESVLSKTYPIARPLFMYTLGEPAGDIKDYIDWIKSDAGQKVVKETGYVPLPKK